MSDDLDPPRKFYGLKPKEFERVNAPPSPAANPAVPVPAASIAPDGRIDVRDLIRAGSAGVPLFSSQSAHRPANEIHDILRDNLAVADAAGLNMVKPRPRWSRRRRDYLITLLLGNAPLIVGTFLMPILGLAGLIVFNLIATWIIWFVMDDY